jgi:hypothetical protein
MHARFLYFFLSSGLLSELLQMPWTVISFCTSHVDGMYVMRQTLKLNRSHVRMEERNNLSMSGINVESLKGSDSSLDGNNSDTSDSDSVFSTGRNTCQMKFLSYHPYPLWY